MSLWRKSSSVMARGRSVRKSSCQRTLYVRRCGAAVAGLLLAGLAFSAPTAAEDNVVKATVTGTVNDGYARLVFDMSEFDDAAFRFANNVLVITFNKPIDVVVDRIAAQIPDYVGAARRDPDGKGVRIALAQQVRINATPAGDKYFVDLLPVAWNGPLPGLPQDVIADLARRARDADRLERKVRAAAAEQKTNAAPVRVHVATQPTFTRYVFAVPASVSVSAERAKDKLTLIFDEPIKFDVADAQAALPRAIGGVDSETRDDSAVVRFSFLAKLDV